MNLLDAPLSLLAAALLAVVATVLVFRLRRRPKAAPRRPELDAAQDWQPVATRVLTVSERQALDRLQKAMPGFLVLAQVPLARFLRVPARQQPSEWLARVGSLSADLLLCDASSRVLAAIDIRAANESERARRRHEGMARVLKAAGISVHTWREDELPAVSEVRASLGAALGAGPARASGTASRPAPLIPVADIAEILADGDAADRGAHEPVPSAFFDEMEPAPAAARR